MFPGIKARTTTTTTTIQKKSQRYSKWTLNRNSWQTLFSQFSTTLLHQLTIELKDEEKWAYLVDSHILHHQQQLGGWCGCESCWIASWGAAGPSEPRSSGRSSWANHPVVTGAGKRVDGGPHSATKSSCTRRHLTRTAPEPTHNIDANDCNSWVPHRPLWPARPVSVALYPSYLRLLDVGYLRTFCTFRTVRLLD